MFAVLLAVVLPAASEAKTHVVGGPTAGWRVPHNPTFYDRWSRSHKFFAGDTLVFNFKTGFHDVLRVPESGFNSCSATNPVSLGIFTGPATVRLAAAGNHYFICTFPGHCSDGHKLAIAVNQRPSMKQN
ncbi:Blue copper protein [Apostasia shenzhenica]|uniref:Blue copper protein n=1 Tax=Apostasia shenzhenica TaxID=1088818 RepID=A0A2I0B5X4_9ASPA|nr:Blue copper protein [Apostasia shenzhenica]